MTWSQLEQKVLAQIERSFGPGQNSIQDAKWMKDLAMIAAIAHDKSKDETFQPGLGEVVTGR